jgi:hypothetical protein
MGAHEFDNVMAMVIYQPTNMLQPSKLSEIVNGGIVIVEDGQSLDGINCDCVVGC